MAMLGNTPLLMRIQHVFDPTDWPKLWRKFARAERRILRIRSDATAGNRLPADHVSIALQSEIESRETAATIMETMACNPAGVAVKLGVWLHYKQADLTDDSQAGRSLAAAIHAATYLGGLPHDFWKEASEKRSPVREMKVLQPGE